MTKVSRRELLRTAGGIVGFSAASRFLGAAGKTIQPNILFFYPDQQRHDWVGANSKVPVRTPNFDRLVKQGVQFTKALTPAPVCAPARACIASGKRYDNCQVASNSWNYPLKQKTVYTMLRDAGYHVMGCGKFDFHKPERDWGLDGKRLIKEWGFSDGIDNEGKMDAVGAYQKAGKPMGPYMQYLDQKGLAETHSKDLSSRKNRSSFPTPLGDEDYCDNWIARNGLKLLAQAPKGSPWFLQVNFNGPHSPWDITRNMEQKCRKLEGLPKPAHFSEGTLEEHAAVRQNYAAMIENIDSWVGTYLEELKKRGDLDNTLIVYSSDHGEMLGDHDYWGKSRPYHAAAGVPLVIAGPGVRKGIVLDDPTEVVDVTATFLDFAGLTPLKDMDSQSLRPLLEGKKTTQRGYALAGLQKWRMVFDGRYKLVRGLPEEPTLFDLETDPDEAVNVAAKHPDVVARLQAILDKEGVGKGYSQKQLDKTRER